MLLRILQTRHFLIDVAGCLILALVLQLVVIAFGVWRIDSLQRRSPHESSHVYDDLDRRLLWCAFTGLAASRTEVFARDYRIQQWERHLPRSLPSAVRTALSAHTIGWRRYVSLFGLPLRCAVIVDVGPGWSNLRGGLPLFVRGNKFFLPTTVMPMRLVANVFVTATCLYGLFWSIPVVRREIRRRRGRCIVCGYGLQGETARCPECGREVQDQGSVLRLVRKRRGST